MIKRMILYLLLLLLSCNLNKSINNYGLNVYLSELSVSYKDVFKDCIGDKNAVKLIPYFYSEKEQILIKNKEAKDFKFEVKPYIVEGCEGLYIYALYSNKLIKRSHPSTKSSFIILGGDIYPASNDSIANLTFLVNNHERLNALFGEKRLMELGRIYKEGIFATWNN